MCNLSDAKINTCPLSLSRRCPPPPTPTPLICLFFVLHRTPSQVRNELTSAEFALNLNGAVAAPVAAAVAATVGKAAGDTVAVGGSSSSSGDPEGVSSKGRGQGGGSQSQIDYDSIAERLEASLRALQAGRPLSLLEAVSEDEVRYF